MPEKREKRNHATGKPDDYGEGRDKLYMDEDRMVNEGLGGGVVTRDNGLIDASATDTMNDPDSVLQQINRSFGQDEWDKEEEN